MSLFGSIASSVIGGAISAYGQESSNKANAKQAQNQMDFEERMSNTAYQRGMKDMEAAGLNPMLAYMKGGASTPSGTSARMENTMAPLGNNIKDLPINSATRESIVANTAKTVADTQKSVADTDLATAQAAETRARTPLPASQIELNNAQIRKISYEIPKILADSDLSSMQSQKIMAELPNLIKQGNLTDAQIRETLARSNLTTAQIAEVQPRIAEIMQHIATSKAELPFYQMKGDFGSALHVPQANEFIGQSAKSLGEHAGRIRMWFDDQRSKAIENRRKHDLNYSK
ncbi:MAG: DNA pilot protein [Microvirus sp.]|nr:MAG: DNA pilot protein [Microvirus sp.]